MSNKTPKPRGMSRLRSIVRNEGVVTGTFFMLVGGIALWMAMDYPAGSAKRMSEGYFPRLVSSLLIFVGAAIAARSVGSVADGGEAVEAGWRPIVFVPLAMLFFGVGIETLGLIPSIFMTITTLAFAEAKRRWSESLLLGAALSIVVYVIFVWALGLSLPLFPRL